MADLGAKAIAALQKMAEGAGSADALGDHVYDIREVEGLGWEGPRVKAWSDGATMAREVLRALESKETAP